MIEFIGKFHPLLVHLPIGFLVVLGVFEVVARKQHWQHLTGASRVVLLLTFPLTVASILCGWLLAGNGEYAGPTLFWHRWLGTTLGAATLLLLALHWCGMFRLYRWALFGTLVLLLVASHFGGSLTHGSDYLAWPTSRPATANSGFSGDVAAQPVFAFTIQPIFNQRCVSCHGPDKAKGKLRLDSREHFLKGGDSGSLIEPPGAAQSLIGKRLALPVDDDDHMPPEAKPQLSKDQLAIINWWLDAGAPMDKTVEELHPAPELLKAIETLAQPGAPVSAAAH